MAFRAGNTHSKGRKAGSKNVATGLRAMLIQSLQDLGGAEYLNWLGRKHPAVYGALVGKLLPSELRASLSSGDGTPIVIVSGIVAGAPGTGIQALVPGPVVDIEPVAQPVRRIMAGMEPRPVRTDQQTPADQVAKVKAARQARKAKKGSA